MSGLAAGIRSALAGRSTLILERHNAAGGLNGFYSLSGHKFDVGLHAVTNYVPPGVKGTPLGRICRQLRLDREAFGLCPQKGSRVIFPEEGASLRFGNELGLLESEVERLFPGQIDAFRRLVERVRTEEGYALRPNPGSARAVLRETIGDPLLREMLLLPLLYYGSARENDVDWDQFVILFRSIFLEGFARPWEGVRPIIRALLDRYREAGGARRMKCAVRRLIVEGGRVAGVETESGERLRAGTVISSIGARETERLWQAGGPTPAVAEASPVGRLTFVETITLFDTAPAALGWSETILFFNQGSQVRYETPVGELVDPRSGVICLPNNYEYGGGRTLPHGVLRVTALANYQRWRDLDDASYRAAKRVWFEQLNRQARQVLAQAGAPEAAPASENWPAPVVFEDMFTPLTIERYTGHVAGSVYGSPAKTKDGRTPFDNLFLCGTDHGYVGIVGALLSGITIANQCVVKGPAS